MSTPKVESGAEPGAELRAASRMEGIAPFYAMALLARAHALEAEGRDIVHMEVGEPDFPTAEPIVQAGQKALADGRTHYTSPAGIPELREAIAQHYQDDFGVSVDPARILLTPGATGALQLLMAATVGPGQEVLLSDPGYPCNKHYVRLFEASARSIPVGPETGFQPTAELIAEQWRESTRAVLVATPSNPTGTLIEADELQSMASVVRDRDGLLFVDEIYQGLVYGREPSSVLSIADDAFVINSFSKYFGMTGWRLGWVVAPAEWVSVLDRLAGNLFLCAPTPAQYAALAAFTPEARAIMEERRQAFAERRDYLIGALEDLGFGIPAVPDGAFYIYADCSRFTDDSFRFSFDLLESAGVAITPGKDFSIEGPERWVRFAYTTSLDRLREAVNRLDTALSKA